MESKQLAEIEERDGIDVSELRRRGELALRKANDGEQNGVAAPTES